MERAADAAACADGLDLPVGLCEAERRAVEMELVFPIPETSHPRLGEAPADDAAAPFRAGRGFVQGVVDLVFEHGGRTYFVDWKSDRLAAWDDEAIRRHVDEHYALQAQLYALGVLRLLDLRGEDDHERALRRPALLLPARHGPARRRRLLRAAELARAARLGGRAARAHELGGELSGGWTPHGVLGAGAAPAPALPPFPPDVVEAAAAQDLGPEIVHLAWELARLASPVDAGEGRALLLLALSVLAAQRDGSTRVPLDAGGPLAALLASLGASDGDRRAATALLGSAAAGEPRLRTCSARRGPARRATTARCCAPTTTSTPSVCGSSSAAWWRACASCSRRRSPPTRRRWRRRSPTSAPAPPATAPASPSRSPTSRRPPCAPPSAAGSPPSPAARAPARPGSSPRCSVSSPVWATRRWARSPSPRPPARRQTGCRARCARRSPQSPIPPTADAALLAAPLAASTLHRLLSYSPSGEYFRRHERNPLAERLVIVDESSMLDLTLAERLLRSLPAAGRLVLLGDARQLPSVEAGAVFRDLVTAARGSGRVAVLTRSWRMDPGDPAGSSILALAESIAAGSSPRSTRLDLREDAGALAFSGAEMLLSPPTPIAAFLERWWQHQHSRLSDWGELVTRVWSATSGAIDEGEAGELARLFAHYESTRLLAPTRGWSGGVGVAAINAWFRSALLRALELAPPRRDGGDADQPLAGEPVLVTRNDYRRALFNGDHGIVLDVTAEGAAATPMAVFRGAGGGFRALPLAALRGHLEPAWASTVHKAQGSEYDAVAVILPSADTRLLTRELLYTAVTRARRSVTLVGTVERLDEAVARAVERWSGIAEALTPAAPEPVTTSTKARSQLALPFPD